MASFKIGLPTLFIEPQTLARIDLVSAVANLAESFFVKMREDSDRIAVLPGNSHYNQFSPRSASNTYVSERFCNSENINCSIA